MLRNLYPTPGFNEDHQDTCLADRPAQRNGASSWPFATTLLNIPDALRRGLSAYRQYEHLKSDGNSHDRALRKALSICNPGM
jgi:hypothetical protein